MKFLKQTFITNWKSTLFGLIGGAAMGYAGYSTGNPELILAGAGVAMQGISSKDATEKQG